MSVANNEQKTASPASSSDLDTCEYKRSNSHPTKEDHAERLQFWSRWSYTGGSVSFYRHQCDHNCSAKVRADRASTGYNYETYGCVLYSDWCVRAHHVLQFRPSSVDLTQISICKWWHVCLALPFLNGWLSILFLAVAGIQIQLKAWSRNTQALTGIWTYGLAFTYHLLCKNNYCENYRAQLNLETEDIWLKHQTQNPKEACGLWGKIPALCGWHCECSPTIPLMNSSLVSFVHAQLSQGLLTWFSKSFF